MRSHAALVPGPGIARVLAAALLLGLLPGSAAAAAPADPLLRPLSARATGDLDEMVEKRRIRALVVPSKTFYFVDRGRQQGASFEVLRAFEDALNKSLGTGHLRVHVVFVPVSRDRLLPDLREGLGDVAAANLTITEERRREVDFSEPLGTGVDELVVTGPASPRVARVDDLAGQEVFVRRSSSYHESLVRLNAEFARAGKPPVRLRLAPETLEDEDLLEMLNGGLVKLVVVDSHKAQFWAQVLPGLRVHQDVAVRTGGAVGWAFRKDSPKLAAAVNRFVRGHKKGTEFGNVVFQKYLRSTKYVRNALAPSELAKYRGTLELFRRYGDRYRFDALMLVAQGYQESQLDQDRRSKAGAVGVMQVLPATGQEMKVGDIHQLDSNVHAGVKYLRQVTDRYFKDPAIDDANRTLFAFASYNAGPAKVARLRREAAASGLDPNRWFNHVERVAAHRIGRETVQYVSNIYKYYVAYRLLEEDRQETERARKAVSG